jgi:hypothetical protein
MMSAVGNADRMHAKLNLRVKQMTKAYRERLCQTEKLREVHAANGIDGD